MTDIPRQELLVKLMNMTTSDNDGEALTALRKANGLLRTAGWDWTKLIEGKIKIMPDPFAGLGVPAAPIRANDRPAGSTPPRSTYSPPPPPPTRKPQTWPLGIKPNSYAGWCYCCGKEVLANSGIIFRPNQFHVAASSDWKVSCLPCNSTATVYSQPASRQYARNANGRGFKPSVNDLS